MVGGVAEQLLAFGRELEAERAAQVGGGFSGIPDADALIESSPNAFLLGVLFTQGIPAERAWASPYLLLARLGSIEPAFLAENPDLVRSAVQMPPMLHRFKEMMPRWIVAMGRRLESTHGGDARRVWAPGSSVTDVVGRLLEFDGIGRKKALMAAEILQRHFGVALTGREGGQVAYDVHVRRVFLRTGLAASDTVGDIEEAAARISPAAPGVLDLAAWIIGRNACAATSPECDSCRLGDSCPRLVEVRVEGVGSRRAG
jgi:uncharacterized HhH-GPD family protein